ncbi:M20/M25/M40 family metallo-hydrolase [Sphingomonas sp. NSE70-1]|uniref:M20/M25/M40 family metallo-hydrolase n=1 Tax=Sphingomonas caseinilyticus TaxID=2908205 RepID=A0ABT0RUF7_9SPHN|nr:M20/M25/M40 family metallo-hydrolase [Sphingomonas caseinilyticus]MCL6698657.1 M20/M25/M40 family metallo-hydrolase [Sphingomonas caseinilyticus]
MRFLAAALLVVAATATAQPSATAEQDSARRVRADVEFLSSDALEGRDMAARGYTIAADYVASQFRAIGLTPAGDNGGWFQQVPFRRASHAKPPVMTMTIGGKEVALKDGADAAVRPSVTAKTRNLAAGFVFVGYGIKDKRYSLDDYRGLDLKGKIAVALQGAPSGLPSDVAAHIGSSKADYAAEAGAIGFVEVKRSDGPSESSVGRGGRPMVDWVDASGKAGSIPAGIQLQLSFGNGWAERLFEGAPKTLDAVRRQAKSNSRVGPKGFALRPTIRVEAESKWEDFTSPEVVGLLAGSDPTLAAEHVVLMAHLDHLGMKTDPKPGEDAIYNGALDNAAGVATMLEAARMFAAQPVRPKRSVLFIANTGEERGLLGADYYANHPTVPAQSIVGLVDLDMPLLLYPFTDVTAFGADHSSIGATVAEAGKSMGVAVSPDPMPEEAIFTRSDHYMFVKRGVPAVLLMTGHANGGAEHWRAYLGKTYHSPQDDLTQKIDWNAGARYALLNYRIARSMADSDRRPMWLSGDYFGDLFDPRGPRPSNP